MSKSLFYTPGIFLAGGLDNGQNNGGDWTPESIADSIAAAGFKWAAQQFSSPDGRPDPLDEIWRRFRARLSTHNVRFLIWEVSPSSLDTFRRVLPAGYIFNIEADYYDYTPLLRQMREHRPTLPMGVITDCGIDPRPFINYNVKAIPEAYANVPGENPVTTPQNMVNRCHEMGWRVVFPCLGVYKDTRLASYTRAGDGWSVFLAEGMGDASDWRTAAQWNGIQVPEPVK